jgi:hypothetical protein
MKTLVPPEPYVAEALGRNALQFLDPGALAAPVVLLAAAALGVYGAGLAALRARARPALGAAVVAAAALAVWWLTLDPALHAWSRYDFRTILFGAVPVLALLAALDATGRGAALVARAPDRLWPALGGALALLSLIHAVETAKFARAFDRYLAGVEALATGAEADPALGDPAFVSAQRLGPAQRRLGWHSTTPFLSVMVAPGLAPERLVVDPETNYYWLSCETATASAAAPRAMPERPRALIRTYSCLHRPPGS